MSQVPFQSQSDLVDELYRLEGLAVGVGSILGLDNDFGPSERFAIRMIAETLEKQLQKLIEAVEREEIIAGNAPLGIS